MYELLGLSIAECNSLLFTNRRTILLQSAPLFDLKKPSAGM